MFNQKLNKTLKLNTYLNINSKTNLSKLRRSSAFFSLASLIFMMLLFSVIAYTTTFNDNTHFVSAYTSDTTVSDEGGLRATVTSAVSFGGQYVIGLDGDITLSGTPLDIPSGADVVLISDNNGVGDFWKLVGPSGTNTIHVAGGATLEIDGIIVTHNRGDIGRGVYVNSGATLILTSGEISENNVDYEPHNSDTDGGGVYNWGTFIMNGGTIQKNSAHNGGGVYSIVSFEMSDGTFSENTASGTGGGVDNLGTFTMTDGTFYKNQATNGGGVFNDGVFTVYDGKFLENKAVHGSGGGVHNYGPDGTFILIDSVFSKNQAYYGGGVYNLGIIEMFGGIIGGATLADGNIATVDGGGVCNGGYFSDFKLIDGLIAHNTADSGGGVELTVGVFNMLGGEISDNTATYGGGAEISGGVFNMLGGEISDNTAYYGGGVFIWNSGTFNLESGELSRNIATNGGGVCNWYRIFNMYNDAVISGNTASASGGGVYNAGYNAVFNMEGGVIGYSSGREGNSAYQGGGVYNSDGGVVTMLGDAAILDNSASFGGGVYNDGGLFYMGDSTSSEIVYISGNTASHGGGVYNAGGDAIFNMFGNAVISDNSADIDGGGVHNADTFNLFGGEISDNSAGTGGGGVCTSGEFNMLYGKISGNFAGNGGGGVLNYCVFNMLGGEISDNTSEVYAGGVANNGSSGVGPAIFNMTNDAVIANNVAFYGGGGVYNSDGAIFNMSEHSVISDNNATSINGNEGRGGGVFNHVRSIFNMADNAVISNNFAVYGGGIFNNGNCTVTMSDNTGIFDNSAYFYGGGAYNWNPYTASEQATFILSDNANISGNSAIYGGGVQNTNNGYLLISDDAVISYNSAYYGGGIYTTSALQMAVIINGGRIANNSAHYNGGGVYTSSELIMTNGIIANNTAANNGGGVYVTGSANGSFDLNGGKVSDNTAGSNGGGVWVTNTNAETDFSKLYVAFGVEFSGNSASASYNRDDSHNSVYNTQIKGTTWTVPFYQGYNNYDISYTAGDPNEIIYYTISYLLNGGVNTPGNPSRYAVGSLPCDILDPSREGYTFLGWVILYVNGSSVTTPTCSYKIPIGTTGDVELTALWLRNEIEETKTYTVTYDANWPVGSVGLGSVPIDSYSPYVSGSVVVVLDQNNLVLKDHVFLGWALTSDTENPEYLPGSTFTILGDTILYAVWQQTVIPVYTVVYDPGMYGTWDYTVETYSVNAGDPTPEFGTNLGVGVTPNDFCEYGWEFAGWLPEVVNVVSDDAIYVAQWKPMMFEVRFVDWNDVLLKSEFVKYGDSATAPANPSRSGYTFTGWSPSTFNNIVSDLTVKAQYTLNDNSGNNSDSGGNNGGGSSNKPQTPTSPPEPTTPPPTESPPNNGGDEELAVWALMNLILSVMGLIIAIIVVVLALLLNNRADDKESKQKNTKNQQYKTKQNQQNDDDNDDEKKYTQRRNIWLLTTLVLSIVGIVVFFLTEDWHLTRVIVDKWTIVNAIIFVVELICMLFVFKRQKTKNTQEKPNSTIPSTTKKPQ